MEKKMLLNLSKKYLQISKEKNQFSEDETQKNILELSLIIKEHNNLYYNEQEPVISDKQWDTLFKLLQNFESQYPQYVSMDSPTQKIALNIQDGFEKSAHIFPMLSLANTYNAEDLRDFDKQIKRLIPDQTYEYTVELKFDGISISITYENNKFVKATTRGNGSIGENVTINAKTIQSIPQKVRLGNIKKAEIRGEIVLPKKELKIINTTREKPFINCRNAASGSLRQLDPNVTAERNLEAYFYDVKIVDGDDGKEYSKHRDLLTQNNFLTSDFFEVCSDIEEVIKICQKMDTEKDSYPFDIDGLVIKVNNLELRELLGATSHHPRWAISYKFPTERSYTKLLDVTFQVGRTGTITPVAELEPVKLSGATLRRATLHNFDNIKQKDIRIGDTIEIERAGEVIPAVVRSISEKRTGSEVIILIPTQCPSCQDTLVESDNEVAIRCINIHCPEKKKSQLRHFVSREAMNIEGLGAAIIDECVDRNIIKDIDDIYQLNRTEKILQLEKIEGMGAKAINKLISAIEKSKTLPGYRLLFALGIPHLGKRMAKTLAEHVNSIFDLQTITPETLIEIKDVGPKIIESIKSFFNQYNIELLQKLESLGLNLQMQKLEKIQSYFSGKIIVLTGSLQTLSRKQAEEIIENLGGNITNSISKKTDILITGENAGSKLEKAKDLEILILTEQDFKNKIPFEIISQKPESQLGLF